MKTLGFVLSAISAYGAEPAKPPEISWQTQAEIAWVYVDTNAAEHDAQAALEKAVKDGAARRAVAVAKAQAECGPDYTVERKASGLVCSPKGAGK